MYIEQKAKLHDFFFQNFYFCYIKTQWKKKGVSTHLNSIKSLLSLKGKVVFWKKTKNTMKTLKNFPFVILKPKKKKKKKKKKRV